LTYEADTGNCACCTDSTNALTETSASTGTNIYSATNLQDNTCHVTQDQSNHQWTANIIKRTGYNSNWSITDIHILLGDHADADQINGAEVIILANNGDEKICRTFENAQRGKWHTFSCNTSGPGLTGYTGP